MQELLFEARGGQRYDRWLLATVVLLVVGMFIAATVARGLVAALIWPGPLVLLFVLLRLVLRRGWTRVGASGITIGWGFGAGRTLGWHEVRWVEVHHQYLHNSGPVDSVRVHLTNGKRRHLPALRTGGLLVDPQFAAKAEAVLAWWHKSTKRSARIAPEPRRRWWQVRRHP
jgi:hypothetical protein